MAAVAVLSPFAQTAPRMLPGGNTVLCGVMVYNDKWGETDSQGNFVNPIDAGIYTIEAKANGKVSKIKQIQDLIKMRAGVKVNSLYYVISTSNFDSEAALTTYYTSDWSRRSTEEIDIVNVPSDLTYDPVTGNVYGFFWNDTTQEYDVFGRFNLVYGEAEPISEIDRNAFAIAANAAGEIYGIWGYTGWLIKINPATGTYEQIGRTGFSPGYVNSLAFDDATGKLYWTANDDAGGSYLFEVNTQTGAATELMHFADNASFAGIYAMPFKVPDEAPAAPTALKFNPETPTSCSGTITLVAPTKTYNGSPLSGPMTIFLDIEGEEREIADVLPGEQVETPTLTLPEGNVTIQTLAAKGELSGALTEISLWAGEDIPAAPGDVLLDEADGKPFLSWTAPTGGVNGGAIDPAGISYTIRRNTDGTAFPGITETQWTDDSYSGGSVALSYSVSAVNAKGESPSAESPRVVFGVGLTPPFTEQFDTADDFGLWSIFDLNGQTTWEYDSKNKNIFYSYSTDVELPGDDWIISPKISLEAGKTYRLAVDAKTYYKGYPENFRFALGTKPLPDYMTQTLMDCPNFENTKGETKKTTFTVDRSGSWYLGLYAYSIAHNWRLIIDNITVEEVSDALPAAVEGLSATPAPSGGLQATITFTMPTTDTKGAPLSGPLSASVYRDHDLPAVAILENLNPGQEVEWTDTGLTESAMRHYRVAVSNEAGEGADAEMEIWVGEDIAGAVRNLAASEREDGTVLLSWEAPLEGAHGGWFRNEGMTYRVIRSDATIVCDATSETSVADTSIPQGKQELFYWLVTPYVDGVKGQYNNTPYEVYGPPIAAPLTETFPEAGMTHYPWVSESDGPMYVWSLETAGLNPVASDQNGDRGMAMFVANEKSRGITGTLTSPKINLSALAEPEMTFWAFHNGSGDSSCGLRILASVDGGELQPIGDASIMMGDGEGWMRHSLSLSSVRDAGRVRIAFESTSDGEGSFYIDNISFGERRGKDLRLLDLIAPERVGEGLDFEAEALIANESAEDFGTIDINLITDGGESFAASIPTLGAGKMIRVPIVARINAIGSRKLTLRVSAEGDTDSSNNEIEQTINCVPPIIPAPRSLSCIAADNAVRLDWKGPDAGAEILDDIENYPDWAISGFGGYSMLDMDGDYTCYIDKDLGEYPNAAAPKSFQICNANTLGIDIWPEGTPHSGRKMLMSVASLSRRNDDWLILPRLNGAAQTISFWAKSFTSQDTPPERLRVLASKGDFSPASFEALHQEEYIEIPDSWMAYGWYVEEGTKWVAINCVSDNAFALFIDDLRFNDLTVFPALSPTYVVYRNGEEVARTESLSWTDTSDVAPGSVYRLRAVYPDGTESELSEETTAESSLLRELEAMGIRIHGGKGQIEVFAPPTIQTEILTADGRMAGHIAGSGILTLPGGVYLARIGSKTVKIIVL